MNPRKPDRNFKFALRLVFLAAPIWLGSCLDVAKMVAVPQVLIPAKETGSAKVSSVLKATIISASPIETKKVLEEERAPETKPQPKAKQAVAALRDPQIKRNEKEPFEQRVAIPSSKVLPQMTLTANKILDLDATEVMEILTHPNLKRREAPAEVWQYAGSDCVLHVFFFPRESDGQILVKHVEATGVKGQKFSTNACLAHLLERKK